MIKIRDLQYLDAVAKHGHFGRAAEACFVSQPTLSGQIMKLEDQLGLSLFERHRKKVMLTPAGKRCWYARGRYCAAPRILKKRPKPCRTH